jgi:SAM-dependent methyltransferase
VPTKVPERFVWAVETLNVTPADHLLEVGCGHGVAVSLVCERLSTGKITAIDRSETMIEMARKRNRACIEEGKAEFQAVTLGKADFGAAQFDKVFAFNVALFWENPVQELGILKKHLAHDGMFYVFHQSPGWETADEGQAAAEQLSDILKNNGFSVREVLFKDLQPTPVICTIAQPR